MTYPHALAGEEDFKLAQAIAELFVGKHPIIVRVKVFEECIPRLEHPDALLVGGRVEELRRRLSPLRLSALHIRLLRHLNRHPQPRKYEAFELDGVGHGIQGLADDFRLDLGGDVYDHHLLRWG